MVSPSNAHDADSIRYCRLKPGGGEKAWNSELLYLEAEIEAQNQAEVVSHYLANDVDGIKENAKKILASNGNADLTEGDENL